MIEEELFDLAKHARDNDISKTKALKWALDETDRLEQVIKERDQKIAAMSEQIIQLERQARIDFNRINELEDIMADNNMLDSQNPE